MRTLLCILALCLTSLPSFAQHITYDPPPALEKQITKADYKLIVDTAVSIIAQRYKITSVKGGTVQLNLSSDVGVLNLDNLILKCLAEKDKTLWPALIHQHFESLFTSIDEQKKIDVANFESVKKYLSLRIYPTATVEARGGTANIIARVDLEDTYTLLMLDLPGAFTNVTKKMFDAWKKDTAEAFNAAQANVDKQKVERVTRTFPINGVTIEVGFLGEENYAASYALNLEHNAPEFVGEWGCAVSMPNKGLVDLCKISPAKPADFVKFIQYTKEAVDQAYREHPQPISNNFFWYYKGKFTRITVVADDQGKINVIAPSGLSQLMTKKS